MNHPSFTDAYHSLFRRVNKYFDFEAAPRGQKIKESLGVQFKIDNPRDRIPFVPERKWSLSYFVAETLWYVSGDNSTEWISRYAPFWRDISDDGKTANSAYGSRIFLPHDRICAPIAPTWTQWDYVKSELNNDRDSRRAVIHIRSPQDSILAKKDVPCTLTLQFFIRDEALHQVVSMRSSDVVLGISYDVPVFTLFQEMLALELGVKLGTYIHTSNSLHIYERHFDMANKIESRMQEIDIRAPGGPVVYDPRFYPAMNKMIGLPNVKEMKSLVDHWNKETDVTKLLSTLPRVKSDFDSYWADFCLVLLHHRLKSLTKEQEQSKAVLNSVETLVKDESFRFHMVA